MSRSRRKNKIHGNTTAASEKRDKQRSNRKFRRLIRKRMKSGRKPLPKLREVSNIWDFVKDGKRYLKDLSEKLIRK